MKHVILWGILTAFLLGIFETAILSHMSFLPMMPDFILLLVVYISVINGSSCGVTAGFFSGILFDFLSIAPFGLHSFIFTIIGFIYGLFYRKYNIQAFFFPVFFGFTATLLKALILFLLHFLFGEIIQVYAMFSFLFLFEVLINSICAPLLFLLLRLFPSAFERQEV